MPFDARPTDYSAARMSETVQEILSAGILPPIVQAGHPVLRHVAAPYDGQLTDADLGHLIDLMRSVMHKAPGVGLAAPQLGIPLQIAVLEDQFDVDPDVAAVRGREPLPFFAMLNPSYRPLDARSAAFYEGCLSIGGLQAAVVHDQNGVDGGKGARPMRDHDRDATAGADAEDGPRQCLFAFGVQVRIWLVEDDKEGIPVESARTRDTLALSG